MLKKLLKKLTFRSKKAKVTNKTQIMVEKGTLNLASISAITVGLTTVVNASCNFDIVKGTIAVVLGGVIMYYYQAKKVNSRWAVY